VFLEDFLSRLAEAALTLSVGRGFVRGHNHVGVPLSTRVRFVFVPGIVN
jgi:hypothetical protein